MITTTPNSTIPNPNKTLLSRSALKNQGMSLRVERSETKQSQGFQTCLPFVT